MANLNFETANRNFETTNRSFETADRNFGTANLTGQEGLDCTACHTPSFNFEPDVSLSGPDTIAINTAADYVLEIIENGSPFPVRGGFQVAVSETFGITVR